MEAEEDEFVAGGVTSGCVEFLELAVVNLSVSSDAVLFGVAPFPEVTPDVGLSTVSSEDMPAVEAAELASSSWLVGCELLLSSDTGSSLD